MKWGYKKVIFKDGDITEDNVIEEIEFLFREQVRFWREEDGLYENQIKELMENFFDTVTNHFDNRVI